MKKIVAIFFTGFLLTSTLSAEKIEYYTATKELIDDMGKKQETENVVFQGPATVVSAVIETGLAPFVFFWNLFQEDEENLNK